MSSQFKKPTPHIDSDDEHTRLDGPDDEDTSRSALDDAFEARTVVVQKPSSKIRDDETNAGVFSSTKSKTITNLKPKVMPSAPHQVTAVRPEPLVHETFDISMVQAPPQPMDENLGQVDFHGEESELDSENKRFLQGHLNLKNILVATAVTLVVLVIFQLFRSTPDLEGKTADEVTENAPPKRAPKLPTPADPVRNAASQAPPIPPPPKPAAASPTQMFGPTQAVLDQFDISFAKTQAQAQSQK